MELITTLANAFIVAAVGALLYWHSRGRFAEIKEENKALRAEIADLRAESNRKFELTLTEIRTVRSDLTAEIMAVRSDLTNVALALGTRPRPEANPA